jgi:acetyl esterase/lipase
LLPFGVAAPEVSPFLFVASLLAAVLAFRGGKGAADRLTQAAAASATLLSILPLAQVPGVVGRFDEALAVPAYDRRFPLSVRDLFLGIATGDAQIVRGIEFAAPAATRLTLDVYRPVSSGPFPVLVQIYGGAWQRGTPADSGWFAQYFASRGYVVFAIDYRHAPRWQWPAQIEDVRAALGWIRAHAGEYDADVRRMALIGRSAGAHLALMAAYASGLPAVSAVVSYYGPTDLAEGWRVPPRPDPLDVRAVLEAFLGGTPDQVPARYREASPVTHVSATVPPTLLVYGTRDHIVEARFGRDLHARLQAAGAASVLLEIPWAEHAFDALPSGLSGQLSLFYTERFLDQTLRP